MYKKSAKTVRAAALLGCLSILIACHQSPQNAIVGKWQKVGGDSAWQFFPDGTVTIRRNDREESGAYSFPDATHLKIQEGTEVVKDAKEHDCIDPHEKLVARERLLLPRAIKNKLLSSTHCWK